MGFSDDDDEDMLTADCPNCNEEVPTKLVEVGDIVTCDGCGSDLVVNLNPWGKLKLDKLETVEEENVDVEEDEEL